MTKTATPVAAGNETQMALLCEEISSRLQAGQVVDPEEYAAQWPAYAEELRRLLPAMQAMLELPSVQPQGAEPSEGLSALQTLGDYRIVGQIGRGGMGVVYEALQLSLGRRVALKVLPFAAMLDERALKQLRNEAMAAAALDHPHIVDVYGVGCERGVHYYAMRLIEGRSLAEIVEHLREQLTANPKFVPSSLADLVSTSCKTASTAAGSCNETLHLNPDLDPSSPAPSPQSPAPATPAPTPRPKLGPAYYRAIATLGMHIAEALDHAHDQGVLHRDIKPSNLMLDSSGKVWITDFGLARLDSAASLTQTGDLLGTLRYMSPEQALAQRVPIDHRSDIYSLGVTLYELLTLQPAFESENRGELLRQVAFEEPVRPRKIDPQIALDLETIVLKAVEKSPNDRYQTATELAADLKRYVEDRHIMASRPSLYSRALKWSRRHVEWVVSASVVAVILLAATTAVTLIASARERERAHERLLLNQRIDDELRQANSLAARAADDANGEQSLWDKVREHAQQAAALAKHRDADPQLVQQVAQIVDDLEGRKRDAQMLALLDVAMLAVADVSDDDSLFTSASAWPKLEQALAIHGIVIGKESPRQAADRMNARPNKVSEALLAAVEFWAGMAGTSAELRAWLNELAHHLNQDPWREKLYQAIALPDWEAKHTALLKLAADPALERQPPAVWINLEWKLNEEGWVDDAIALLRRAQFRFPDNVWVNHHLGNMTLGTEEAVRCQAMAVALRPKSAALRNHLGWARSHVGKLDEALADHREAIRMNPSFSGAYVNISRIYMNQGRLDEAIRQCRQAIRIHPNYHHAHYELGECLRRQGKLEEAEVEFREACRLRPDLVAIKVELHKFLLQLKRGDEVIAECRKDVQHVPQDGPAHYRLGWFLNQLDRLDEAAVELREAARLAPRDPVHHFDLGLVLHRQGKLDEATAAFRAAIRVKPTLVSTHLSLVGTLRDQEKLDDAIAACREAIRLTPPNATLHFIAGSLQAKKGMIDEALAACDEAIRLKPDYAEAHYVRGFTLEKQGKLDESLAAFNEAIRLKPDFSDAHSNRGVMLERQGKLDDALAAFETAIQFQPNYAPAHVNRGKTLRRLGRGEEAAAAYRQAIHSDPGRFRTHFGLGSTLDDLAGKRNEAVEAAAALNEALRLNPDMVIVRCELAGLLASMGDFQGAREEIKWFEQAFAKNPSLAEDVQAFHRYNAACAAALASCSQGKDADETTAAVRSELRRLALDWLGADVATRKLLAAGDPALHEAMRKHFAHALKDPDFQCVREALLLNVTDESQVDWRILWDDIAQSASHR